MPSIRKTKTGSGAIAVQVVRYHRRKVVLLKHIGSARKQEEIEALIQSAEAWVEQHEGQTSLFTARPGRALPIGSCTFVGVRHAAAYRTFMNVAKRCGFDVLADPLVLDLAIIRIFEPCSKRRSRILLERHFGIRYSERTMYRALRTVARHHSFPINTAAPEPKSRGHVRKFADRFSGTALVSQSSRMPSYSRFAECRTYFGQYDTVS